MDAGIGHQVGLEVCEVHIEGAIKTQGGSDGGHHLADKPVEVAVGRVLDVQVAIADIKGGLIVHHEDTVGVFQTGVSSQDGVIGFYDRCGHSGRWVDDKLQLGLLAIVYRKLLHQQGGKA